MKGQFWHDNPVNSSTNGTLLKTSAETYSGRADVSDSLAGTPSIDFARSNTGTELPSSIGATRVAWTAAEP